MSSSPKKLLSNHLYCVLLRLYKFFKPICGIIRCGENVCPKRNRTLKYFTIWYAFYFPGHGVFDYKYRTFYFESRNIVGLREIRESCPRLSIRQLLKDFFASINFSRRIIQRNHLYRPIFLEPSLVTLASLSESAKRGLLD